MDLIVNDQTVTPFAKIVKSRNLHYNAILTLSLTEREL